MFRRKLLYCSFCGKDETRVAKLVAGPKVYICDACVATASEIIDKSDGGDGSAPGSSSSRWGGVLSWIRKLVSRGDVHGRVAAGAL